MADQPAQLQRGALGLTDVIFQGITHLAPALSVVFIFPPIAKRAGPAMALSLALAVLVCFFIANTVAQFSRYLPTSGGYYTFVTHGLGARLGFLTTWSYLIYEIVGPAGAIGYLGFHTAGLLPSVGGALIPWWIISIAIILIVWGLAYFGVRISSHTMAVLGALEILIMIALGVTFLVYPAGETSWTAPLDPRMAPDGWAGVFGGMLFSILAVSGFEAPAPLAQETRRPTSFVYLAIFLSLLIVGVLYVFLAYGSAISWGAGAMQGFAADPDPYDVLATKLWGKAGSWLVYLAIINSVLAVGIACTNAASRVLYTMARAGAFPAILGKIHPVHKTPYMAIHLLALLQIASFLLVGFIFGPKSIFDCLGTITGLAVIVLYVLANLALTVFFRREHPKDFHLFRHGIVPAVATLFLIPATVVSIWAVPDPPENLMPYIFVGLMIVGLVVMIFIERRRPKTAAQHNSKKSGPDHVPPPANQKGDDRVWTSH